LEHGQAPVADERLHLELQGSERSQRPEVFQAPVGDPRPAQFQDSQAGQAGDGFKDLLIRPGRRNQAADADLPQVVRIERREPRQIFRVFPAPVRAEHLISPRRQRRQLAAVRRQSQHDDQLGITAGGHGDIALRETREIKVAAQDHTPRIQPIGQGQVPPVFHVLAAEAWVLNVQTAQVLVRRKVQDPRPGVSAGDQNIRRQQNSIPKPSTACHFVPHDGRLRYHSSSFRSFQASPARTSREQTGASSPGRRSSPLCENGVCTVASHRT